MKLLLLLGLAALSVAAPVHNTTGKGLGDLINKINNIENDLLKTVISDIKTDVSEAAQKKASLEEAAIAELREKASEFKQKVTDAVAKFEAAKAEAEEKIEQERERMIKEFREKVEDNKAEQVAAAELAEEERQQEKEHFKQKMEEKKAAKQAERDAAKAKFDEFAGKVKERLAEKKAAKEQKRAEIKAKLDELAATVKENREARKAEKEKRKENEKKEREASIESFKSRLSSLAEEKSMLEGHYEEFEQKEKELQQELVTALGEGLKSRYAESVEDYLQENLEKEYVKRGVDAIMYPAKQAEGKTITGPGPVVQPAPKASLIDQLTGKSSWETVAWVLLALCIVLAIALIALIIFQVRQSSAKNGNYERLDGNNQGGSTAPPLGGSEKQGLLGAGPKSSLSTGPGGYSDMSQKPSVSSPSAPIVEEPKEEQAF